MEYLHGSKESDSGWKDKEICRMMTVNRATWESGTKLVYKKVDGFPSSMGAGPGGVVVVGSTSLWAYMNMKGASKVRER